MLRLFLGLAAMSALSLTLGFYAGLPVPLDLLRLLVIILIVGAVALAVKAGFDAVIHRDEGGR